MRLKQLAPLAVVLTLCFSGTTALAAPLGLLVATYTVATPPTAVVQGGQLQVAVDLKNTGDEVWLNAGANPVNLTYHWYDMSGAPVLWDGLRTALPASVPAQGTASVAAKVNPPANPGVYQLRFALVKEGVAWFTPSAPFNVTVQAATLTAAYQAPTPPASLPAGGTMPVQVTVTNTGNQTWNTAGANPVNLTYHWYDATGNASVIWDGARTALGTDMAPTVSKTVDAQIVAPPNAGTYQLRFALVKEGVAWFPPSAALNVNAVAAFTEQFTAPVLPAFIAGGTYTVPVTVKNVGVATWNFAGANPINVSYHWHDMSGNTVVWDGMRTTLGADVAPGASATINAKIATPSKAGTYQLTIDLVREGVGWLGLLGSTPFRGPTTVDAARFSSAYAMSSSLDAYWAEQKTVNVTLTNTGNQTWTASGPNPVNLAFHIFDPNGQTVVWDGARTALGGDLAPGQTRQLAVKFAAPSTSGAYSLVLDLVREGIGWFQDGGSPVGRVLLNVTSGLNGGYAATTTPGQVTIGATIDLKVTVVNYSGRTWARAGTNPVSLSYHISGANSGTMYVWDGARGILPTDVPPGSQVEVPIRVTVPQATGDYIIGWDLVQEGVAWFSSVGVASKKEPFTVVSGVVFYGSGFGHGVGMSQYGANGLATGVTGRAYTGEQIIQQYFPGTTFQFGDASRPYNRVLLSQPSSTNTYRCGTNRYFDGYYGDVVSNAGFKVLDESKSNIEVGRAPANAKWQFVARNGIVEVWDNGGASPVRVGGDFASVAVVPLDPNQPLRFVQKDQLDGRPGFYRGNLRFSNLGNTLRVVNAVSYDDYTRGVISFEMPNTWHAEALKAQAYAARSYAYASYRGGARDYDVSDDQADQCYGGVTAEGPRTDLAVAQTAGKLVTYSNAIVKTYFSSSSGGYTLEFGCWGTRVVRAGGTWVCTPDPTQPYLASVPDPADRLVNAPVNPRASWTAVFTGSQIVNAVICAGGPNIGTLQGVDVTNTSPVGVGHVISVRFIGTAANADIRAESLRSCLPSTVRSTMFRLSPF